jgi:transposase
VKHALEGIVCQHLTVARVAEGLGVSWNTANDAVLAEGRRVLIEDPHRFDGVRVIGVDEHCWRHTRRGDKYVTVIIDLTPIRDGTGPARLLDMVQGRSKQVFKAWLGERDTSWRDGIEVVAMDGFTGFKTATKRLVKTAGTTPIGLHGARHSYAEIALAAGVRLDVVSRTLGHASSALRPINTATTPRPPMPRRQRS